MRRRTFKCGKDAYEDGKDEIMFSEVQQPLYDQYGNLLDPNTGMIGTTALPNIEVIANPDDVARGRAARWYKDFGIESNDATSTPLTTNRHLKQRSEEGAAKAAAWAKDHPYLNMAGLAVGAAPFAVAAAPIAVGGSELVEQALANPYVDAALTSMGGAHAAQSLANGEADWMTALELAPLGRLARRIWNAGKEGLQYVTKASENVFPHAGIDYSDLKSGIDNTSLFEKLVYQNKINGFPRLSFSGKSDVGDAVFSPDVVKGISVDAQRNLMHNTVGRNIREFEHEGYDNVMNNLYKEKAQQLFDDVNVGRYSGKDYAKAGEGEMGGFFNQERNFISINRDSGFPETFVEEHEGRHLLDHNTSMLDSQYKVLSDAYDNDFINIPNTEYAGSLKDYKFMDKEKVTTNRDARDMLFDKFGKHFKFADYGI